MASVHTPHMPHILIFWTLFYFLDVLSLFRRSSRFLDVISVRFSFRCFSFRRYSRSTCRRYSFDVIPVPRDNSEVNMSICEQTNKPMIGFASNRFNTAVKDCNSGSMPFMNKIFAIMSRLKTLKLAAKLRKFRHLEPMTLNVTRSSSIGEMLKRSQELEHILKDQFASESSMLDSFLSPKEENEVNILQEK